MPSFDPRRTLAAMPPHAPRVAATRTLPARAATTAPWPAWVAPEVRAAFEEAGVAAPYRHQVEAAEHLHAGRHCVLATGTASGKSLAYLLPALSAISTPPAQARRPPTVLYLAPTKALAADQLAHVQALGLPGVRAAVYDGDTPTDERAWIRRHADIVLTNPDMLHRSILPGHRAFSAFVRGLQYVVVDECHSYRGVFGTHVAATLRRLRRLAVHHRAHPTFAFASATVAHPAEHASALLGADVVAVTDDTSPAAERVLALLDPTPPPGEDRRSTLTHAAERLADLVDDDVRTVAFTRSRAGAEVVADTARRALTLRPGGREGAVAAYRGGYLPEDRRLLEKDLREGRLLGVASTSALELGIDIDGLDAVVLAGWPGTTAAWWQRAGRAGRAGRSSLVLFVADEDPLDAYLVAHPEALFDRPLEACVIAPDNPHILAPHLLAAAYELPLRAEETAPEGIFGPTAAPLVARLTDSGLLRRRPSGWFWTRDGRPHDDIALRGIGAQIRIVEDATGRIIGTVDAARADGALHTGAVHLHQGHTYVVRLLDLEDGCAHVVHGDPGWITTPRSVSSFVVLDVGRHRDEGDVTASTGRVSVRSRVTSFLRRLPGGEVLGQHPLDLPERAMTTSATWWTLTPALLEEAGLADDDVPGALHAAEHAMIGLLPLLVAADRWDIGGVSTACHPDTGLPTIMIYDGHPGGAGFVVEGYVRAHEWLTRTRDAVAVCPCATGCPSCVQSPKCGNGNEPLDKAGAIRILGLLADAEAGTADTSTPPAPSDPGPHG
ncbi:DEAD/DEAH box helicase [Mobilicoccus pelagius]|uniref:Putative ATP-dependent helicase n=1 Tax=Mobilicoccus pelagius NBRC 104925 TaxID=1089455 RepID=H5UNX0_9MICO|nr:DEAD/DEAH box helicase [Mobilicoccus pelagius]GAB47428.1 putative ATP-dependent helicase [Mobilicoccus pelagius NBRC 104925]